MIQTKGLFKLNSHQILIIIFIFILIFCGGTKLYTKLIDKVEIVNINGKEYYVRSEDGKEKVAEHLATISEKVDKLVKYMVEKKLPDNDISLRLQQRWGNCKFREIAINENSAAYTINKGEEMRLCVREISNDGGLENLNTSMFVVLHELGHLMSVSYGHNDEFKNNFSYIVHLASSLGYYKPEDFENKPVNYCGTEINTTPCMSGMCEYTSIPVSVESFINNINFY